MDELTRKINEMMIEKYAISSEGNPYRQLTTEEINNALKEVIKTIPQPEEYTFLVKVRGNQVAIYGVDQKSKDKLKDLSKQNEGTNNS